MPFWTWAEVLMRGAMLCVLLTGLMGCATGRRQGNAADCVPSIWPTREPNPRVGSPFGYRKDPIEGDKRFHTGIDIRLPKKSLVVATADGVVVRTGRDRGGYGRLVRINHGNGYETWYAHLRRIKTKEGRHVKHGTVIGTVGATGRTTAPHLHYEVRLNGKPVDPCKCLPQ